MSHRHYWPENLRPCGTPAAYRRHLRHHEPACRKCLDAHNQATKQSQERGPGEILTFHGDLTDELLEEFKARWEALQRDHTSDRRSGPRRPA